MKILISSLLLFCATLLFSSCRKSEENSESRSGSGTVTHYEPLPVARAQDGRRLALVIGNSKYDHERPLKNPENDAAGMAGVLQGCGFEVTQGTNLSKKEMKKLVREFTKVGSEASVLFFYYAGHGVMVDGRNYLHPRDAHTMAKADIEEDFISLEWITAMMNDACRGAKILALDCCRNNPVWARLPAKDRSSASQGMGTPKVLPDGTIMFFATKPYFVAADGTGFHSPFAEALILEIKHSGHLNYTEVFNNVGIRVVKSTERKQRPQIFGDYYGKFYFQEERDKSSDKKYRKFELLENLVLLEKFHSPGKPFPRDVLDSVDLGMLEDLAAVGNPQASYLLGRLKIDAETGLFDEPEQAVKFFESSSRFGYVEALTSLAFCYYHGKGVAKDVLKALDLAQLAANQGEVRARHFLGCCYLYGDGLEEDKKKGVDMIKAVAEEGYSLSQRTLGNLYLNGLGVEFSKPEGLRWLRLAAEQNECNAQIDLGFYLRLDEGNNEESFFWFEKAALQGDSRGWLEVGNFYASGSVERKSKAKAEEAYLKYVETCSEFGESQYFLGFEYWLGLGIRGDKKEAVEWFRKAAKSNSYRAKYMLGKAYWRGAGVERNIKEALVLFEEAANGGIVEAQLRLAHIFNEGWKVPKDFAKASEWFEMAAESGDAYAQWQMGEFTIGYALEKSDYQKALGWYSKAAEQGNMNAEDSVNSLTSWIERQEAKE